MGQVVRSEACPDRVPPTKNGRSPSAAPVIFMAPQSRQLSHASALGRVGFLPPSVSGTATLPK